jgi:hypothetical protein
VVVDRHAVEPLHEHVLQPLSEGGAEPLAWERDDDRHLAPEQVLAHEDPDPGVLLELEEPDDQPPELIRRPLEQLVLGECAEELHDGLVVVGSRDQILGRQDLLELVVQQRRLRRGLHVRLRREQADQPPLARDPPVGRDLANADVVHPRTPVHRGVRAGLRDHQEVAVLDPLSDVRRERVQRGHACERARGDVGQDPQPRSGGRLDRATLGQVEEVVLAVPEQDEVELEEPVEEVDRLANLLGRVPDGRQARQVHHVTDAVLHRLEIADDEADVVQDRADRLLQLGPLLLRQPAFELDVHHRFAMRRVPAGEHPFDPAVLVPRRADHRVQEELHAELARGELLDDRVHQEGRVVRVRLDDRADRPVAVVGRRNEHADRRGMVGPLVDEPERGGRDREQRVGSVLHQILVGEPAQEGLRERRDGVTSLGGDLELDAGEECFEDGVKGVRLLGGLGHGGSRIDASFGRRGTLGGHIVAGPRAASTTSAARSYRPNWGIT